MKYFKLMPAFCASLAVMFAAVYFISFFPDTGGEWYTSLKKPSFAPYGIIYEMGFFAAFAFAVISCAFTMMKKELRIFLAVWAGIIALSLLWPLTLFKWHSAYGALGISFAIIIGLTFLIHHYIKNTRELWLAIIPTTAWFVYIFAFNFGLCMLN